MTGHVSEDELVLYRYRELNDVEQDRVEQHLRACEPCRHEYAALQRVLAAVDVTALEPSPSYERDVWVRVQERIASEPRGGWREIWRAAAWWPQTVLAATVAVLLIVSFIPIHQPGPARGGVNVAARDDQEKVGPGAADAASGARGRVLLAALDEHLQRSEFMLTELHNLEPRNSVDLSNEQAVAEDLVSDNRLYRRTAVDLGDRQTAGLLDDLERALLDVAHAPSSATPAQIEHLRDRLDAQGVLFKVRVAGAGMRERQIAAVLVPGASGPAGL